MTRTYSELKIPNVIRESIDETIKIVKDVLGIHLKEIILYGSYARGDYKKFSDVDLLILTDLNNEEIVSYRNKIWDEIYDIELDNDVILMPLVKNINSFENTDSLYTENVNNEGVLIYG